jgi:hypothetical protein
MPHPDTLRTILVILSFICLLGLFKRPFWGVVSYLIIMMLRPSLFYDALSNLRVELFVGLLMLAMILFSKDRFSRIKLSDSIYKWMFFLTLVMAFSMLQAFDFDTSFNWVHEFLKVFAFFIMIVGGMDNTKDVKIFLSVFGVLTCFFAYVAIYNYQHGIIVENAGGGRVDYGLSEGMGAGHVALANITLQGMPFLWFLSIQSKTRFLKIVGLLLFTICLYGVVISGSRGGFAGIVVLALCLIYFSKKRAPLIVCCVAFFLILPLISASGYLDYIKTIIGLSDLSASSRISGLSHGFEMLIKRPILGVGPGCYPLARKAWFHWGMWAHNHYGELMGDLGIIGTVVWFTFLKNYLTKAWKCFKDTTLTETTKNIFIAVIVATMVRLVVGMGSHSVYIFFWYMMAAVTLVLARGFSEEKNLESDKEESYL